jgi:hypothetical protein
VPIQPLRDLCPDLESVFQVTNKGNDSVADNREAYDGVSGVEAPVEPVSCVADECADNMEGVDADELLEDELELCSRDMLGF